MEKQLTICLRVYPRISKNPIGNFKNKYDLFQVTYFSLLSSLKKIDYFIFIILDNCPNEYKKYVEQVTKIDNYKIIEVSYNSNIKTFNLQKKILLEQKKSEIIFLCEDDYLFLENGLESIIKIMNKDLPFDFITPYYHIDYDKNEIQNLSPEKTIIINNQKYCYKISTTLTFITTRTILKETLHIFETFSKGNYDFSIFASLTAKNLLRFPRPKYLFNLFYIKAILKAYLLSFKQIWFGKQYKLIVPLQSVATHLEKNEISPNQNWEDLIKYYKIKIQKHYGIQK